MVVILLVCVGSRSLTGRGKGGVYAAGLMQHAEPCISKIHVTLKYMKVS